MYHIAHINRRIYLLVVAIIGMLSIIAVRLFHMQINQGDHYQYRGERNFMRIETTPPRRGNIVDCRRQLLATNRPVHNLIWHGTGNRTLADNQLQLLRDIEQIVGKQIIDNPDMQHQLIAAERYYRQIPIAIDITLEQLSQLTERYPDSPNLSIQTEFKRHYPYGTCASHVIGYLTKTIDMPSYGQMGIEKICDTVLKGQNGSILKKINSFGQHIASVQLEAAAPGSDILTTIDLELQKLCEEVFPTDHNGCMIMMDPETGDIKAMVSRPQFDPTLFLGRMSPDEWHDIQEKKPFLNRALCPYPPGSIFKLITASAGLEHGYLSADQHWFCNGYVTFADRKYHCSRKCGHGDLTTVQAIAHSCNCIFFEIGKKMDVDLIARYARMFGLGQPTGILFPERTGIVPCREWKMRTRGERWWPGETLSVAIGQSFLLVSPMQVVRMMSGIFTGHLVKPRLLIDEPIETTQLMLRPETIRVLKESMRFAVTRGTGQRVNTVKDIEIYAKTSTAQVSDLSRREDGQQFLEHAWFAGYFRYKEYKPLAFAIMIENAGSSQEATMVAKKFLLGYKDIAHML